MQQQLTKTLGEQFNEKFFPGFLRREKLTNYASSPYKQHALADRDYNHLANKATIDSMFATGNVANDVIPLAMFTRGIPGDNSKILTKPVNKRLVI